MALNEEGNIVERVIKDFVESLSSSSEFNESDVTALKRLAEAGELANEESLSKVIRDSKVKE